LSPAGVAGSASPAPIGSETPVRDRLVTTLFLAALVHGILILGVTFSAGRLGKSAAPGLDVQLLAEDAQDEPREREAAYLAQASRVGAGTTSERIAARTPYGAMPEPDAADGQESRTPPAADAGETVAAAAGGAESVLASSARRPTVRYSGPILPEAADAADLPLLTGRRGAAPRPPPSVDFGGEDAVDSVQLTGPAAKAGAFVSPDTRRSILAPYLDGWRRKVERLGTLNYPTVARDRSRSRWPVVEVELAANGRLTSAKIRRSSGDARLDAAALEILKLASPFDPFPTEMAKVFPELGFAYEWRFESGGPLSVPPSP
jgi:protein TonB